MARPLTALLTTLLATFLFGVLIAPTPAGSSASPTSQDKNTKFREEFDKAAKLGSKSKMDQLMRDGQEEGIYWILITAEQISSAPNDILFDRFEALKTSWTRVYETQFPQKMEVYFAYADAQTKKDRFKLKQRYDKVNKAQVTAMAEKDAGKLNLVADEYTGLAEAFNTVGDKYFEGQCRLGIATCLKEEFHGKRTDFNRVATSLKAFVLIREDLGVRDTYYKQVVPWLKSLEALGFGGGPVPGQPGGGDEIPAAGPKTAGESVQVSMEFETLKKPQDGSRLSYYADMHHQIWPAVALQTTGTSGRLPRIEDSPTVTREGSAKAMIDTNADGTGDVEWPIRGKLDPIEFEIGTGASKRKWSALTETGREQDFYQGQQMNLQMTDASLLLYFLPTGSMVGEVSGTKVRVVDDNQDGIYGSPPLKWRNIGMSPEVDEPEFDSIYVGKSKVAQPWSQYVNLGKAGWHRMEAVNGGTQINAQPMEFKTGTITLKAKGLKPSFFVLKGMGPDLSETYIDVANGKKVEVPIGRWEFVWGIVRKGKKMQEMKAVMLPGKSMKVYDVTEDAEVEIEIGAPYGFDYDWEKTADGAVVDGPSVHVIGKGGETYERIYQSVPSPEANVRKKGSKRAIASEQMRPVVSNDGIEKHGWAMMWKPLTVQVTAPGNELEVQLFEKKNRLFGKIESDWK